MLGELDDMALEMMDMFESMTEPLIEDLKSAHGTKDWNNFSEIGHSLKGSAKSIGAIQLGDICASIQDDTPNANDETRTEMLNNALNAFTDIKAHIQYLKETGF